MTIQPSSSTSAAASWARNWAGIVSRYLAELNTDGVTYTAGTIALTETPDQPAGVIWHGFDQYDQWRRDSQPGLSNHPRRA